MHPRRRAASLHLQPAGAFPGSHPAMPDMAMGSLREKQICFVDGVAVLLAHTFVSVLSVQYVKVHRRLLALDLLLGGQGQSQQRRLLPGRDRSPAWPTGSPRASVAGREGDGRQAGEIGRRGETHDLGQGRQVGLAIRQGGRRGSAGPASRGRREDHIDLRQTTRSGRSAESAPAAPGCSPGR